jgi:hypothetical protein
VTCRIDGAEVAELTRHLLQSFDDLGVKASARACDDYIRSVDSLYREWVAAGLCGVAIWQTRYAWAHAAALGLLLVQRDKRFLRLLRKQMPTQKKAPLPTPTQKKAPLPTPTQKKAPLPTLCNLPPGQRRVLDALCVLTDFHRTPPLLRDMSTLLGIQINAVRDQLFALERKGFVHRAKRHTRAWAPTQKTHDALHRACARIPIRSMTYVEKEMSRADSAREREP